MPNPTATIYPPYHAIDDLIQRGTRAAQPAAATVTPGTLYGVTDEGNAVERSNGMTWQAYGATSSGVAAHHATHEPGGSDALTALSASILTSGTVPVARLGAGTFTVVANSDTGTVTDWVPGLSGNTLVIWIGTSSDLTINSVVGGTIGQLLAVKNVTTHVIGFTHNYGAVLDTNRFDNIISSRLTSIAYGGSILYQHDGVIWRLMAHEQGGWITPAFSAANFAGAGGVVWTVAAGNIEAYRYRLTGRTLDAYVGITGSTLSGTSGAVYLSCVIPGGFSSVVQLRGLCVHGAGAYTLTQWTTSGNQIFFTATLDLAQPWPLGSMSLFLTFLGEVT